MPDPGDDAVLPFVTNGYRSGGREAIQVVPIGLEQRVEERRGDLAADERVGREGAQRDPSIARPGGLDRQFLVGLDGLDQPASLGSPRPPGSFR